MGEIGHSFGGGFSFCRNDRKNRYFRDLSQQVLSGVVGVTDFVLLTDPFRNRAKSLLSFVGPKFLKWANLNNQLLIASFVQLLAATCTAKAGLKPIFPS